MIVFLYGTIKYIIMIIISRHLLWLYVNRTIYYIYIYIYIYPKFEILECKIQLTSNFRGVICNLPIRNYN